MDVNPQQIVKMIRDLLGHPGTENSIREQMLELARKNIHVKGVVDAVVDAMENIKDSDAKKRMLKFVMSLEENRFSDVQAVYGKLISVLKNEKDRALRSEIIQKLSKGLQLEPKISALMVEILGDNSTDENEKSAIMKALATMTVISEALVVSALEKSQKASSSMQMWALQLTSGLATWSNKVTEALTPYLDPKMSKEVREEVWRLLSDARRLNESLLPLITNVLKNETNDDLRAQAMGWLNKVNNGSASAYMQLIWTSLYDRSDALRARATEMLRQSPQMNMEQVQLLAKRLFEEPSAVGRKSILNVVRSYVRDSEVRESLAQAFSAADLSAVDSDEFEQMMDMLYPYVTREAKIKEAMCKMAESAPQVQRRTQLIEKLIQTLKLDSILPWIAERFLKENDPKLREVLFEKLFALSISKHTLLIKIFSAELREPSSPFRLRCASVLAPVMEQHSDVIAAFEDVMLHDQDRELLRTVTEAYVKPSAGQKANVLIEVVRNEALEISTRRLALEKLSQTAMTDDEQKMLTEALQKSPLNP